MPSSGTNPQTVDSPFLPSDAASPSPPRLAAAGTCPVGTAAHDLTPAPQHPANLRFTIQNSTFDIRYSSFSPRRPISPTCPARPTCPTHPTPLHITANSTLTSLVSPHPAWWGFSLLPNPRNTPRSFQIRPKLHLLPIPPSPREMAQPISRGYNLKSEILNLKSTFSPPIQSQIRPTSLVSPRTCAAGLFIPHAWPAGHSDRAQRAEKSLQTRHSQSPQASGNLPSSFDILSSEFSFLSPLPAQPDISNLQFPGKYLTNRLKPDTLNLTDAVLN